MTSSISELAIDCADATIEIAAGIEYIIINTLKKFPEPLHGPILRHSLIALAANVFINSSVREDENFSLEDQLSKFKEDVLKVIQSYKNTRAN